MNVSAVIHLEEPSHPIKGENDIITLPFLFEVSLIYFFQLSFCFYAEKNMA